MCIQVSARDERCHLRSPAHGDLVVSRCRIPRCKTTGYGRRNFLASVLSSSTQETENPPPALSHHPQARSPQSSTLGVVDTFQVHVHPEGCLGPAYHSFRSTSADEHRFTSLSVPLAVTHPCTNRDRVLEGAHLEEVVPVVDQLASSSSMQNLTPPSGQQLNSSYACEQCHKQFSWPSHLQRHLKTHSGDRPYTCFECGKCFTQVGNLNTHVRTHTGARPYACDFCGKRFRRVDNLNMHRRMHTGVKPFSCPHCAKAFTQAQHLTIHIRVHTGEQPFRCEECGRTFKQMYQLRKHTAKHETATMESSDAATVQSDALPYVCCECRERFARPDELWTHYRYAVHAPWYE